MVEEGDASGLAEQVAQRLGLVAAGGEDGLEQGMAVRAAVRGVGGLGVGVGGFGFGWAVSVVGWGVLG